MKKKLISIIGRPNVGKSTLFNRIIGQKKSIVSDIRGVTRDRVTGSFNWLNKEYAVVDTGGFIHNSKDLINREVNIQSDIAQNESDLILLVMDSRQDITANDRELAQTVLRLGKPYIFVLNKVDQSSKELNKNKFYELGLSEPMLVSAQTGYNIGDLLDKVADLIPTLNDAEDFCDCNLAVIGMPNVGKSSFVNKILNKNLSIVSSIAGTTRDSVDSFLKYYNKTIRLVDTAGLRKRSKIKEEIEFYSLIRTERALDQADVAIVIIDADLGFRKQDRDIVRMVVDQGKGMVLVVNKWDLIEKNTDSMRNYVDKIVYQYPSISHYPIIFTSVTSNKRVQTVLSEGLEVFERRTKKIKTKNLNIWLDKILQINPPPSVKGKYLKIKYISQIRTSPPLFVFFTNHPDLFPIQYKRYLENQIRKEFDFKGVAIKISFRAKWLNILL